MSAKFSTFVQNYNNLNSNAVNLYVNNYLAYNKKNQEPEKGPYPIISDYSVSTAVEKIYKPLSNSQSAPIVRRSVVTVVGKVRYSC